MEEAEEATIPFTPSGSTSSGGFLARQIFSQATGLEGVTSADVKYFADNLRAWHERSPAAHDSSLRRRSASIGRAGGPRIRMQMSAPVGGSNAMAYALRKFDGGPIEQSPSVASAGSAKGYGQDAEAEFVNYNLLRKQLNGLAKHVLVELWITQHRKMVELGHVEEAAEVYDKLQKATLSSQESMRSSLRIADEGREESMSGMDNLLKEGLLAFLMKIHPYLLPLPAQVIKFKDVSYKASLRHTGEGYETVGSKLAHCLLPFLTEKAPPQDFFMLKSCSGYLMPGTLTLVCGPPGCGKTSLHKALSGRIHTSKGTKLGGVVKYNNVPLGELQVHRLAAYVGQTDCHLSSLTVRETCEFAAECTTLFSSENVDPINEVIKMVSEDLGGKDLKLEMTLHLLGLSSVADTPIGSRLRRGISGGERHRVTTAEMICGIFVACFLDEISTGLDSSATYDIVTALRTIARVRQTTFLLSLLQPAPEVFDLFDRLIVLDQGAIVYQGPRVDVLLYFESLGYKKPHYVDVADFLQEVTTEMGVQFLQPGATRLDNEGFVEAYHSSRMYQEVLRVVDSEEVVQELWVEAPTPLGLHFEDGLRGVFVESVEDDGPLAKADIQFTSQVAAGDRLVGISGPAGTLESIASPETLAEDVAKQLVDEGKSVRLQLERPLGQAKASIMEGFSREYAQDIWPNMKTVLRRQFKVAVRNTVFITARVSQVLILGVFTGTVFYQTPAGPERSELDLKKAIAFLAALAIALGSFAQLPIIFEERQVFQKQYDARFFRPATYVLASILSQIPFLALEITIYAPLVYWLTAMSGSGNGAHFIVFVIILFLLALVASSVVRLVIAVSATRESAASLTGLVIITMLIFSGFLITKNDVRHWWIWMYYFSPLQWGVTAVLCNELLSDKYNQPCSELVSTVGYCRGSEGSTIGEAYLAVYKLPTTYFHGVWLGIILLFVFYIFFISLTLLAVSRLHFEETKLPPASRLQVLPKQTSKSAILPLRKKRAATTGSAAATGAGMPSSDGQEGEADPETGSAASPSPPTPTSAFPFQPCILSFHDLVYEIDIPGLREPRMLLGSVSGFAKPGTMTALMGSSGAGKTTLLDVLAGRKTMGRTKGEILVNGFPKVQATFAHIAGYVEQNDIHTPFITIRESLEFSAALRLPKGTPLAQRAHFVDEAMDLLELHDISHKLVGNIGDGGLAIEQAKRLTIGVELVANPSVLFLDEPTSGLDSRAAQIVINGIQNIVNTGRSVLCTIHQPSRRLFFAFDQLLLLKRGGEVVYFGPIGHNADDLLGYFESLPGVKECSANQNPASYMLEIIGAGIGHAALRDFAMDYKSSSLYEKNLEELDNLKYGRGMLGAEPLVQGFAATWPLMLYTVIRRQFLTYWRNVAYSFGRMMFSIILGLLLGSTYWQIEYDSSPGLASRAGLIYVALIFVAIVNANNVIPQVNAERPVYYREGASHMYSSFLYNLSWGLAEIPYLAVSTLLFCAVCFSMAGIATDSAKNFFQFWFIFFEYSSSITFFGIFLAMVTPNPETASIIIPVVISIWNIISGFMIPKRDIPDFWIWLYWLNPTQYALNALTSIAFYCDTESGPCSPAGCVTDAANCPACTCPRLKDADNQLAWTFVAELRSLKYGSRHAYMAILLLFIVVFRFAAYFSLKYMRYNKR